MDFLGTLLLGLVQGLAEFLPISSSGHLRLLESVVATPQTVSPLTLEILLHAGTLGAVILWLRNELIFTAKGGWQLCTRLWGDKSAPLTAGERTFLFVILASIPTAIIGLGLKKAGVEKLGPIHVAACLVVTGVLNLIVRRRDEEQGGTPDEGLTWKSTLFIGIAQGFAVLPGISRSGATIAAGYWCGMPAERAARFSFLISVPAVGGATLLELRHLFDGSSGDLTAGLGAVAAGAILAFFVGLLALKWLFSALDKGRFHWFAYYCWAVAALVAIVAR